MTCYTNYEEALFAINRKWFSEPKKLTDLISASFLSRGLTWTLQKWISRQYISRFSLKYILQHTIKTKEESRELVHTTLLFSTFTFPSRATSTNRGAPLLTGSAIGLSESLMSFREIDRYQYGHAKVTRFQTTRIIS
jgi:hypothetical protein